MGSFFDKVKEVIGRKETQQAVVAATTVAAAAVAPICYPIALLANGWIFNWNIKKKTKWNEAFKCLENGKLTQAKEKFYAFVNEYGWDDLVCYTLMEIHDKMQAIGGVEDIEDIVSARNLAIHLIGSNNNQINKINVLDCYRRNTSNLQKKGFAKAIVPAKRQYIYIVKDEGSIGGTYLMDKTKRAIDWIFDIEGIPEELVFQPGHPLPNTLYVRHPQLPNHYYSRKNVEQVLFDEKVLEFVYLMSSLGATKISYELRKGSSQSLKKTIIADAKTKVGVKVVGVEVDPTIERNIRSDNSVDSYESFEETFTPMNKIFVPDDLVWYDSEKRWQGIVRGRKIRSVNQFNYSISSKQSDFVSDSLDAEVKSKFRYLFVGVKGDFGSKIEKETFTQEETEWSMHVDFAPLDKNLVPVKEKQSWLTRIFGS